MAIVQIIGVIIALIAIQMTTVYYRRSHFRKREYILWLSIWIAFLAIDLFPRSVQPLVSALHLERPMDLIMIVSFVVLFLLSFHNYSATRQQSEKIEQLVRHLALKDFNKKP